MCHWIARDKTSRWLELKRVLLAFHRLHGSHDGKAIASAALALLDHAGITAQVCILFYGHLMMESWCKLAGGLLNPQLCIEQWHIPARAFDTPSSLWHQLWRNRPPNYVLPARHQHVLSTCYCQLDQCQLDWICQSVCWDASPWPSGSANIRRRCKTGSGGTGTQHCACTLKLWSKTRFVRGHPLQW